ncbi:MAG: ATP-binding protein [Phycisphaeraceae bacterium]
MDHVLGQDRAIDVLQTQLAAGRPHHAYVFHGPAGVGKFTTALAFGRVLLCHQPQTDLTGRPEACGSCPSCRLLPATGPTNDPPADEADDDLPAGASTAHPDLRVVTKELARFSESAQVRQRKLTSIPLDVLKEALIGPVYRRAQLGHGKVFIVDEAELMGIPAQNVLLKTLEEPPAGTTIILVTASEDRLLPTIRSRCQRVAFVPLADEVIRKWLDRHAAELIERDRQWLAQFAAGSLGRAELALEYGLTEWAETVIPALEGFASGRPRGELGSQIAERIDAFAKEWVSRHDGASKEAANRLAAGLMWSLIASHARTRIAELAPQCPAGDLAASEAALEPWLGVIDAVQEVQQLLASNVHLGLACDHLVTRMAGALAS